MNEFDQFIKHTLKVKSYVRYTDDFVIVSEDREYLRNLLPLIDAFLSEKLTLTLHPKKIIFRPFYQGIDFLGYIALPNYRAIRTKTKRRMFRKIGRRIAEYERGDIPREKLERVFQSYLGVLSHADAHRVQEEMVNYVVKIICYTENRKSGRRVAP